MCSKQRGIIYESSRIQRKKLGNLDIIGGDTEMNQAVEKFKIRIKQLVDKFKIRIKQ